MTTSLMPSLQPLVGSWRVTGGAEGTVRYEWLPGGHFLLQHVDLVQDAQRVRGLEVIGHLRPYGEAPTEEIQSRFYDEHGNTLDYVYELQGETLHIWAGEKGSPVIFVGTLQDSGRRIVGTWDYAGQGGYSSTMTRLPEQES